jgi:phage shock protein A
MSLLQRVKLLWRTRRQKEPAAQDVLLAFRQAVSELEAKSSAAAVALGRLQAREEIVRGDAETALELLGRVEAKLATEPTPELLAMKEEYQRKAIAHGQDLREVESERARLEKAHERIQSGLRSIQRKGEGLEGRLQSAEASRSIYAFSGGLDSADGRSPAEKLLEEVRKLEAQSAAAFELADAEVHFDAGR